MKGKQPDFPNQLPLGAVVETKMGWKAIRFINDKIEIKTRFKFKWDAIKWVRGELGYISFLPNEPEPEDVILDYSNNTFIGRILE